MVINNIILFPLLHFIYIFSAESGFSDGRDDESDEEVEDEDEKLGKRVRIIGSRRRSRKVRIVINYTASAFFKNKH